MPPPRDPSDRLGPGRRLQRVLTGSSLDSGRVPAHTHDETGIIHVESPTLRDFTLGESFDVWGVRFDAHCIGGACDGNGRTLSVYVNGQLVPGDPRAVTLEAHQEIVVALGTPSQLPDPIPSSYAFPAGY